MHRLCAQNHIIYMEIKIVKVSNDIESPILAINLILRMAFDAGVQNLSTDDFITLLNLIDGQVKNCFLDN